jgi:hypothetical protein
MGAGRFACVLLPIILTVAAIVSLLVATLAGVAHNRMFLFSLDTEDLTIDPITVQSLANDAGIPSEDDIRNGLNDLTNAAGEQIDSATDTVSGAAEDATDAITGVTERGHVEVRQTELTANITARDLDMAREYDVTLWGFCYVPFGSDDRHCTDAELNWAGSWLNDTALESINSTSGYTIYLPDEITGPLRAYREMARWTAVAFIIALVCLGVQLVIGIMSNFSRIISCVTWLFGLLSIVLVGVAASMATAQAAIVVGIVEATAFRYGVQGSINTDFLAAIWIGFAFTLVANTFWLFTVCCCKNNERKSKRDSGSREKWGSSNAYKPLGGANDHEMTNSRGFYNPQHAYASQATRTGAYEPYSQQHV